MGLIFALVVPMAVLAIVLFVIYTKNRNIVVKTLSGVFAAVAVVGLLIAFATGI